MRHLVSFGFVVACLWSLVAQAVIETYEFDSPVLRERYQQFTEELRCPKCQNQNLSGSNSPIAKDLRRELHKLLHDGYSDQQITDYMVDRYGEFVLYRPRVNEHTVILWVAPAVLLLLAALVVFLIVRKQAGVKAAPEASLSKEQQQKLDALLQGGDDD